MATPGFLRAAAALKQGRFLRGKDSASKVRALTASAPGRRFRYLFRL